MERWAQHADAVRFPEPTMDMDNLFLFEAKRKVQKDRTVSLHGIIYEIDAALVGEKITLRYEPGTPIGRPIQVWHEGQQFQLAKPVDVYANCFVRRQRPSLTATPDTPAPEPYDTGLSLHTLDNQDDTEEKR